MDIEKAKILSIGEIKETRSGHQILSVVMQTPTEAKRTFVVYQNRVPNFDLVKLFKRGFFKVGQSVRFNFNKADEDWKFDSIWKMKLLKDEKVKA